MPWESLPGERVRGTFQQVCAGGLGDLGAMLGSKRGCRDTEPGLSDPGPHWL